ncbi:MAG TPA: outer membrane beta-barrel protein [Bacteroidia bacterium]|nr:outer membrane beta-barrel protein [Bacteroidia bacterium]
MNSEGVSENNSLPDVQMLAQHRTKKTSESTGESNNENMPLKNIPDDVDETKRGEGKSSDRASETVKENSEPNPQSETINKQTAMTDSGIADSTTQAGNNSDKIIAADSAVVAVPVKDAKADSAQAAHAVKDTTEQKSGFSAMPWIGIYASWDFTGYHLKENNNVTAGEASTVFNSSGIGGESSLAQYTVGIMGGLRVSQKLALEAGALYSQKRKLSDTISSPAGVDEQGNESFSDFIYNYNAKYIEAYGRVKYYFLEKKHSFYAGIGAAGSFNFPSAKKDKGYFERTTFSEAATPQTDIVTLESSSVGLSIVVSAGMEVIFSQRWNLFVEAAYKHALTSVTRHPYYDKIPVEHFWRTFSLGTGLMYKF